MKTILKISVVAITLALMLIADLSLLHVQLVPEANAIFGVRRRAFRRGVIIGASAGAVSASAAESQQQAAVAQQQAATAQEQAATAQEQAAAAQQQAATAAHPPPPATTGKPLPLGTVVSALPAGCTTKTVGDVEYYYHDGNYYRAVFQGNNLVYVTAKP